MGRASVWNRLLWKEYREARWVVLIGLIAPWLCFSFAREFELYTWQRSLAIFTGAAGIHLAIALWAAGKGGAKRSEMEFARSHLPVSPIGDWAFSMIGPLIVTGALGLWFGHWAVWVTKTPYVTETVLAGALDLSATYAICYLMSLIIASWAAVLFGAFRVAAGTIINAGTLNPFVDTDTIWFVARTVIGCIAGSFLFSALAQKKGLAFRQATSLMLMVAIVFVPAIWSVDVSFLTTQKRAGGGYEGPWFSSEYGQGTALDTHQRPLRRGRADCIRLRAINYRANTDFERDFDSLTAQLGTVGDRYVFLASQPSTNSSIRIVRWDSVTNQIHGIGSLPCAGRASLVQGPVGRVSPDGRHASLILPSSVGEGYDIWHVDLITGSSTIVAPCLANAERVGYQSQGEVNVSWLQDGFIIVYGSQLLAVDYKTLKAKTVDSLEQALADWRQAR